MPVQSGNQGQILRIDPPVGDVGDTITVRIQAPNPGQFEFNQTTRIALLPDSQSLLTAIQGGTFPSGFVNIRVQSVTIVSPTELRFQIPQAVETIRLATGVDRFYVNVGTPPGWAWSTQPLKYDSAGTIPGFTSGPSPAGIPLVVGTVSPTFSTAPIALVFPLPSHSASIPRLRPASGCGRVPAARPLH